MRIGVLALQGAVQPHLQKLRALGAEAVPVRTAEELAACDGLIIPGGESTTFLNLMRHYKLLEPLVDFARAHPLWGVCAGSIVMADQVENPAQESLHLVPIGVRRNAYGRQNESFITEYELRMPDGSMERQEGVFIRAPQIIRQGEGVQVLAELDGKPIVLRHGHHLITTFHPELSNSDVVHRLFVSLCSNGAAHSEGAAAS